MTMYTLGTKPMEMKIMKSTRYIFSALTLLLVNVSVAADSSGKDPKRPNIILLMGDDHGWEEVADEESEGDWEYKTKTA